MRRWTNEEDRLVVGATNSIFIDDTMEKTGRTRSAILSRRSVLRKRPCPQWVWSGKGDERWFCEQGEGGHYGTCCGGRSVQTYIAMGIAMGGTWP